MDDQAFPRAVSSQPQPKRPKTLIILAVFLILLGLLLFVGSRLLTTQDTKEESESSKAAPTAIIAPSETPTPSEEVSPTPKKTVTTSPSKSPSPTAAEKAAVSSVDKATGLDRSTLSVSILNGSGVSGVASKMSTTLKDLGYVIGSTGNADNFDYQNVSIQVKSTKSKYLPLLKSDIGATYTVGDATATLASGSADAVIIIGK